MVKTYHRFNVKVEMERTEKYLYIQNIISSWLNSNRWNKTCVIDVCIKVEVSPVSYIHYSRRTHTSKVITIYRSYTLRVIYDVHSRGRFYCRCESTDRETSERERESEIPPQKTIQSNCPINIMIVISL